jgi:transcriptional regulator with XRE-family HTH domain
VVLSKKEIGSKIKEARKIKSEQIVQKYTQKMLANELGISRGYLGDVEAGRTYPNYILLSKIADVCRVPFNFFGEDSILERLDENKEESAKKFNLTSKEEDLILRFRKLPPTSQQTVLTLIDNLEIIDKTKTDQLSIKESEVG